MAMNTCVLMGRCTKDPEKRYTQSNTPVTSFTIAVDRFKDGVDFFDCTAWNKTADFVNDYFRKGDMICVRGRLQNREWTDKDGNNRRKTEIVVDEVSFCGGKGKVKDAADGAQLTEVEDDGDLPF